MPGPQQILLIRHAEKPGPLGIPPGLKENGHHSPHSLTVRGWQRAGALAHFFCEPRDGYIGPPTHVFAPPLKGAGGDHGRPNETVTPLAAKLGLDVQDQYGVDAEADLVADVLTRDGIVLIAWEHKRIPWIANAILGDETSAPQTWNDSRYDVIWVFDRDAATGRYRFRQRPQLLLGGDSPEPIAPNG